ncbi:MAG: carboxylating nicotinate-nucleotide diphosphorylase [Candidatus Omnitrophica bacterium]|nr:carboxylating nicotinate-nucleotide diphosphorylase [Candidatus Omnitrophota bacterium]
MDSNKKTFLQEALPILSVEKIDSILKHALIEDIGHGDITTLLTIPKDKEIKAKILLKEDCIVCGLLLAERAFKASDKNIEFKALAKEGKPLKKGKVIAEISGNAASILTAERVALNFLSLLSAVATKTKEYVEKIEPYKTKITDTRKTIPGLRELQKYAVRIGGGYSHRMGLDEMILIKDNHLKVTEGYTKLPSVPKGFKIEVEVQNLDEFKHAIYFKPDVIMLDNMSLSDIKEAVKIRNNTEFKSHHPPTKLEASGGVNLDTVKDIAATGVDIISVGDLTHSVKSIDMSLEVE